MKKLFLVLLLIFPTSTFAATYYADPAGSNDAPYETWLKAATNIQTVVDLVDNGEIIYARGTQTLSAQIDIDGNSGTGIIKIIGCNALGNVDGTKFVLDGDGAAASCIQGGSGVVKIWLENIECTGATGNGITLFNDNDNWVFINVSSHDNGEHGFKVDGCEYLTWIRCQIYGNGNPATGSGIHNPDWFPTVVYCAIYDNYGYGIYQSSIRDAVIVGNIFHDMRDGYHHIRIQSGFIYNNNIDGTGSANGLGIYVSAKGATVIGNRITNIAKGIDLNHLNVVYGWNVFHDVADDLVDDTYASDIPYDSDADTNEIDPDVDDGYNDVGNHDFNIKADRTLRRTEIDLGIGN